MRNHVVVLLRNFQRERLYTAINIVGLALGLASCLLLGLFLKSELTYDQHYPNHENIYRIVNEYTINGRQEAFATVSGPLGPMMADEYPNVIQNYVRIRSLANQGVRLSTPMRRPEYPEKVFYWEKSYFADDRIFAVFPVEVLHGDPKTALVEANSVAISETVAKKYFGDENPIGKQLLSDAGDVLNTKVTLVFRDQPANTHLKYDLLFSYNLPFLRTGDSPSDRNARLLGVNDFTYVVMHPSFKAEDWRQMSGDFAAKYMTRPLSMLGAATWRSWLQPLAATHMQAEVDYDRPNGNKAYIYGCAAVALIILVIACINYMNLATARATRRARSVAFRKILGASRLSLATQFLVEALLFSGAALALAVTLVALALKFTSVADLLDHKVDLHTLLQPRYALWLVGTTLGIGLLSGLYPALYLSSWAPIAALTGKQQAEGRGSLRMREFLVLVQFTISAAAIAATLLMIAQMHYVATVPLGFEREHRVLVLLRGSSTIDKIPAIRNELLRDSSIRGVAVARNTPADTRDSGDTDLLQIEGEDGVMAPQMFDVERIGDDYVNVMGLTVTQGRDLSSRLPTDDGANVLVNEALVRKMGWSNPIGKRIVGSQSRPARVVGVVQNFNFKTLHHQIAPLVMYPLNNNMSAVSELSRPFQLRYLILEVSPAGVQRALEHAERVMKAADARHPFEYRFLDESLSALYKSENALTKLIGIFAAISISIACMGLFGLAAFTTEQRTREIGIRKVLGATTWEIVGLLARRIVVLMLIASALAGVAAYFAVDEWLQDFAYRADINPLVFVLSAALTGAVAFGTVAAQSWRTANADPVQSLQHS
jgi:putative ABC transport system permease protein